MATPNPITLANLGDPASNPSWTFDGSNFLTGASGVGITIGAPTGGDIANSINVSGGYYVNGVALSALFAPIANPTFTGTATAPTADITTLNATTLNAGNNYLTAGGKNILTQRASTILTGVGSLYATASTSFVMYGMGSSATITPVVSGTVLVLLVGNFVNTATGVTGAMNVYYGTGTPPAQGAAATGTALLGTAGFSYHYSGGTVLAPFAPPLVVTGLTLGTAYWFDFGMKVASGSGNNQNEGGNSVTLSEI